MKVSPLLAAWLLVPTTTFACGGPGEGAWVGVDLPSDAEMSALFATIAWIPAIALLGWMIPAAIQRFGGPRGGDRGARTMGAALAVTAALVSLAILPLTADDSGAILAAWNPVTLGALLGLPFAAAVARAWHAARSPRTDGVDALLIPALAILILNLGMGWADLPLFHDFRQLAAVAACELTLLGGAGAVTSITFRA